MKNKELIQKLKQFDQNLEIVIFAEGNIYKPENLQIWTDEWTENKKEVLEIGCGWNPIDEEI